jgi:hypothetical protein
MSSTIVENRYGVEFSPTASGVVNSLTADVAVFNIGAPMGTPAFYQFYSYAAPPTGPVDLFLGTPIDQFIESVSNPSDALANVTFLSTMHPFLTADDEYWLYQGMPLAGRNG